MCNTADSLGGGSRESADIEATMWVLLSAIWCVALVKALAG